MSKETNMRKLTYILSDFQTVNPEEVFNRDREVLGNILGVPFADEAIITTSKNERGYELTITCNHLDTTIYDSAVSIKNTGKGLLMIDSVVNYDSMGNELLKVGAFNLTRQLIELVLGIKPIVIDETQNIIAAGVSTL